MDKAVINQLALESLRGRRVFVRIDAHNEEPWSGPPVDESKLRAILPTLAYLTTVGARALVATHIGNPGAKPVDDLRVNAVAERLSQLTGKTIRKLDEAIGRNVLSAVMEMQDGEIVVLENLCFYPVKPPTTRALPAPSPSFAISTATTRFPSPTAAALRPSGSPATCVRVLPALLLHAS